VVRFMIRPLYSEEKVPSVNLPGGWVGSRDAVDASKKRRNLLDLREIELRFPSPGAARLFTIVTELSRPHM